MTLVIKELYTDLIDKDRIALSKAITLVESENSFHRKQAAELMDLCINSSFKSWRIAISGPPGVGKSTFIESFGSFLTDRGHRLAVLAIDPSSDLSKGSILADKTRMPNLSQNKNAFIRPSPSSSYLGGIARSTHDSIKLCESAGFDVIIIETVGVGQSEILAAQMVDLFMLLIAPGSGDHIQGIKRGIMELADIVVVNKVDSGRDKIAKSTVSEYKKALHLLFPKYHNWKVPVTTCSAVENKGMGTIYTHVEKFFDGPMNTDMRKEYRIQQDISWLDHLVLEELKRKILGKTEKIEKLAEFKLKISNRKLSSLSAAIQFIEEVYED